MMTQERRGHTEGWDWAYLSHCDKGNTGVCVGQVCLSVGRQGGLVMETGF